MPLPWEQPTPPASSFVFPAAPEADDGYPFGNPIDGKRVLAYLAENVPTPTGGDILAAFGSNGAPKTRRQVVIESLNVGLALAGAAAKVQLNPEELQAAVAASPGFARAVEIAMNEGDAANVGDGSGLSRWRFARTGNADKPEDNGDAGTDYNDMKDRLRALMEAAPGWEPVFEASGAA